MKRLNYDVGAGDWKDWLRGFERFALASDMKEQKKKDWLLHYAGPKVQSFYCQAHQGRKNIQQKLNIARRLPSCRTSLPQSKIQVMSGMFFVKCRNVKTSELMHLLCAYVYNRIDVNSAVE